MTPVNDYLEILPTDSQRLRGLRWAEGQDAIEYGNGQTFAPMPEVFSFLEGFASLRPLMHFGHVLHFMYLLRHGGGGEHHMHPLARTWREAGRPARTAGAFCAFLCRDVPPVSAPPGLEDLSAWLATYTVATSDEFRILPLPEEPLLTPGDFEEFLAGGLDACSEEELLHWFRHGQPPVGAQGEELARAFLADKPLSLDAVLSELSRHDRLSGAVPFVARFVSALTLPPRRLIDRELPLGGYADVTTRGAPDQILPGQFALDELEFLRRYAEHELLYYRREQPASRTPEELVVLLDQGVRTWGKVRLVLTAAVFALGQLALRRKMPLLLAGTASGGHSLDPLQAPSDELAELLSASDLTPQPALALEQVLADRNIIGLVRSENGPRIDLARSENGLGIDLARSENGLGIDLARSENGLGAHRQGRGRPSPLADVVLLTHPRNLAEPDVLAAARTVGGRPEGRTRLFAVAVDAHGDVDFCEIRRGVPVTIGRFHVDLTTPAPAVRSEVCPLWKGDFERVIFPFRFGLASNHERLLFAFDPAGTWILTASQFGMLLASRTDGSSHEILPRVVIHGKILADVHQVLGVSGGFVVAGAVGGLRLAAVHYDFTTRMVRWYEVPVTPHLLAAGVEWRYVRRQHLLLLRAGEQFRRVFLLTGCHDAAVPETMRWQAQNMQTSRGITILPLPAEEGAMIIDVDHSGAVSSGASDPGPTPSRWNQPRLVFDSSAGALTLQDVAAPWEKFLPLSDGQWALRGWTLQRADCRGDVLAALFMSTSYQKHLWLFRGPGGQTISTSQMGFDRDGFALSPDGRLLALQRGLCQVEVRRVQPGCPDVLCVTPVGRFHNNVAVELGDRCLCLAIDRTVHLARWDSGRLVVSVSRGDILGVLQKELAGTKLSPEGVRAVPGKVPGFLQYDPGRFRLAAWRNLIAVVDAYGEVFLFEHTGELVCAFFAFRQQLAAWIPDGACLGPEALLGRPATANAEMWIGRALALAWARGEGKLP